MATLQEYMDQSTIPNMFESEVFSEVWGTDVGVDNSVGKIRKMLVHRPGDEIEQLKDGVFEEEAGARILRGANGRIRNYFKDTELPDLGKMQYQHDAMTQILKEEGIELVNLEDESHYWTNLLFARDVALMVPKGAILTRFAMYFHAGDPFVTQKMLAERKPASLKLCTLLDKPARRETEVDVDYTGFQIPDAFVVGYGLDYAQRYRNLPYIGVLEFVNED